MTPVPERNAWTEFWQAVRERAAAADHGLRQWGAAVREEPALIWQTSAIRYGTYSMGGLFLLLILKAGVGMLQLPEPANVQPRASTALFNVICSNPQCGKHFVIKRKFRFRKFPVDCPTCKVKSGYQALRCTSDQCRGRLVLAAEEDGGLYCSQCGKLIAER